MQQHSYKEWVIKYAKRYWYLVVILLFLSFGAVFFQLIAPLPLAFLADNIFGTSPVPSFLKSFSKTQLLIIAAVAYVVIYTTQSLYVMGQSLIGRKFNQIIDRATLNESNDSVLNIPYNDLSRQEPGTYLYQITDQSQQMSEFLLASIVSIAQSLLTLIGVIIVLSRINLKIMLITFIIIPLLAVCVIKIGKLLERRSNETELAHSKLYAYVDESLSKLRTVQAFALEGRRKTQLQGLVTIRNKKALAQLLTSQKFDVLTQFIIMLGIGTAIYFGGESVFIGTMTFGALLIFIDYTNNVFGEIGSIIDTYGGMKVQSASLQQAYNTILFSSMSQTHSGTVKEPIKGNIEFKMVTMSHGTQEVLNNVNLIIPANTVTAFVGLSGSGKTTLLNALLRLETPMKGYITIDGRNIQDYDLKFLREHIGLIEQEPDLFLGSIANNISIANPDQQYNLPDIMASASLADAGEFIDKLPDNYHTVIDNHKLSGGQKQRIAAARAYYKRAPILLMDEPTSALDKDVAKQFIDNIIKNFAGRTIILITHDLNLLREVSTIYVVKDHTIRPISEYGGLEAYGAVLGEIK